MINSPVVKIIEAIALQDLQRKIEPLIANSQVGFISKLNRQTNILRLLGSAIARKKGPYLQKKEQKRARLLNIQCFLQAL